MLKIYNFLNKFPLQEICSFKQISVSLISDYSLSLITGAID
jgi:hypothetical protein